MSSFPNAMTRLKFLPHLTNRRAIQKVASPKTLKLKKKCLIYVSNLIQYLNTKNVSFRLYSCIANSSKGGKFLDSY